MILSFTKMEGCGNDYLYFNCLSSLDFDPAAVSVRLSDRHFGVGGDGIILLCPSLEADAKMRIFNADGSEGRMCGNGIRCAGKYLYDRGLVKSDTLKIETLSGVKTLLLQTEGGKALGARVGMERADFSPESLPVGLPGEKIVNAPATIGGQLWRITCVSMGNPHCVVFGEEPEGLDLSTVGPLFAKSPLFPEGVNTEFVRVISPTELAMRVWERGSGETFACGTGACAAVSAAVANGYCQPGTDVSVHLRGGTLTIRYTEEEVFMTGPAREVFQGTVQI